MDPNQIPALITAFGVIATPIGVGIGFLYKRSDARKAQEKTIRKEHEAELHKRDRQIRALYEVAERWRLQLVRHDIDPEPPGWPEVE